MTSPVVKRGRQELVTTLKVKNLSKQPIAGFKIEEFWYDARGRCRWRHVPHPKPLQPDEIIDVTLTDR